MPTPSPRLRISLCTLAQAAPFLALHYTASDPARPCRILGAWLELDGAEELVGILTVSFPTLNANWRESAWPREYSRVSKREAARKLNAEVRHISRVVVHPRHRGQGIATALVRAYLRRPLTTRTEAVASMGNYCACFKHAGMRAVPRIRSERDRTLASALHAMHVSPETLVDDRAVQHLATTKPNLTLALTRWANASRATRPLCNRQAPLNTIAPLAAKSLLANTPAWIFETKKQSAISGQPKAESLPNAVAFLPADH